MLMSHISVADFLPHRIFSEEKPIAHGIIFMPMSQVTKVYVTLSNLIIGRVAVSILGVHTNQWIPV